MRPFRGTMDWKQENLTRIPSKGSPGRREPYGRGTKGLLLAVLADAVRVYCDRSGRLQAEAESWMSAPGDAVFSFAVVCETVGLDPDATRLALMRLRQRDELPAIRARLRPNTRRV